VTRHSHLPEDHDAATINADFFAGRTDITGFYDEHGRPAPWPDDLDDRRPSSSSSSSEQINFDF
jgi:hypothetical protein